MAKPRRSSAPPLTLDQQAHSGPDLPPHSILTAQVYELTEQAHLTAQRQRLDLGDGLSLHAYPLHDRSGTGVALSHPGPIPQDWVRSLQAATPWTFVQHRTQQHAGRHWVMLERSHAPPATPPKPAATARDTPSDPDPPDAVLRALLLADGPWRNAWFTPEMHELRDDAVRVMKRAELQGDYAWTRKRWPEQVAQMVTALTSSTGA